jgi:hypothetical protein
LSSLDEDRNFESKFEEQCRQILAREFIIRDLHRDLNEATDFIVFGELRAAMRVRRYKWFREYWNQFTIRFLRPGSGVPTEVNKFLQGLVQWFLYAFCDENESKLVQWAIFDLSKFDVVAIDPRTFRWNTPPDSLLAAYNVAAQPKGFTRKFWVDPAYYHERLGFHRDLVNGKQSGTKQASLTPDQLRGSVQTPPISEPFVCQFCKAKSQTYFELIEHYDQGHSGMRP